MHQELTHHYLSAIQPQSLTFLCLGTKLYPNSYNFFLVGHLNIPDTITIKNVRQYFATYTLSPTNHCLWLLQNQFLLQFYFHDLNFSYNKQFGPKTSDTSSPYTKHKGRLFKTFSTSNKTVNNSVNDNVSLRWLRQFAIPNWHQDLKIGSIKL